MSSPAFAEWEIDLSRRKSLLSSEKSAPERHPQGAQKEEKGLYLRL